MLGLQKTQACMHPKMVHGVMRQACFCSILVPTRYRCTENRHVLTCPQGEGRGICKVWTILRMTQGSVHASCTQSSMLILLACSASGRILAGLDNIAHNAMLCTCNMHTIKLASFSGMQCIWEYTCRLARRMHAGKLGAGAHTSRVDGLPASGGLQL